MPTMCVESGIENGTRMEYRFTRDSIKLEENFESEKNLRFASIE